MLRSDLFGNMLYDAARDLQKEFGIEKRFVRTDIIEKEGSYEIYAELAGYEKENITIKIEDGVLCIEADSIEKEEAENEKYIRREIFKGKVGRSFYVGKEVKKEDISAEFKNGILKVIIKKPEVKVYSEEDKIINIL